MPLEKAPRPTDLAEIILRLFAHTEVLNTSDTFRKIAEEYPYWDKLKHWEMRQDWEPEALWAVAKIRRQATSFRIAIGRHNFYWNLTGEMQRLLHEGDMHLGGTLRSEGLIPAESSPAYLVSSLMEEAIASSQIEGAVTTRKVAKDMLRAGRPPRNTSERMVVNNYRTIRHILSIKEKPLTPETLTELQALMTAGTLDDPADEGRFRNTADRIVVFDHRTQEVAFDPPAADELTELVTALCAFCNAKSHGEVFIHPIVKAAILHFLVGYIHPFPDGNGRTARALFYWYLLREGYWLTEYLSISKMILKTRDAYAKAYLYTEADDNDLTYFIRYQLRVMATAYDDLKRYILRKQEERRRLSALRGIEGLNERQTELLRSMADEPSRHITVKEAQRRLGVSNQTARTDLQNLAALGYLEAVSLNGKTQGFKTGKKLELELRGRR